MKKIFKNISLSFLLIVLISFSLFSETSICESPGILSDEIIRYTEEIGEMYSISPEFIQAVIESESTGKVNAFNGTCIGLMQINPKSHKKRMEALNVTDLYDAYTNILVGTDFLHYLFETYEDPYLVLMCYNMGESKVIKNYENDKISKYVINICERSYELERLHGK